LIELIAMHRLLVQQGQKYMFECECGRMAWGHICILKIYNTFHQELKAACREKHKSHRDLGV
jgi:hypothetical protein